LNNEYKASTKLQLVGQSNVQIQVFNKNWLYHIDGYIMNLYACIHKSTICRSSSKQYPINDTKFRWLALDRTSTYIKHNHSTLHRWLVQVQTWVQQFKTIHNWHYIKQVWCNFLKLVCHMKLFKPLCTSM
jgi:hypothetical protein